MLKHTYILQCENIYLSKIKNIGESTLSKKYVYFTFHAIY